MIYYLILTSDQVVTYLPGAFRNWTLQCSAEQNRTVKSRYLPSKTWTVIWAGFVFEGLQTYVPESEGLAFLIRSELTVNGVAGELENDDNPDDKWKADTDIVTWNKILFCWLDVHTRRWHLTVSFFSCSSFGSNKKGCQWTLDIFQTALCLGHSGKNS